MRPDYPSEADLDRLQQWKVTTAADAEAALDFAVSLWKYEDCATKVIDVDGGRHYTFITLGWSGNESIIGAINRNLILRLMTWRMSAHGGLHVYEVRLRNNA